MVLPSDHFITDEPGFLKVVAKALEGARAGHVTTIGIVPTRPETGYGYVEIGAGAREARRGERGGALRGEAGPSARRGVRRGGEAPVERGDVLLPREAR